MRAASQAVQTLRLTGHMPSVLLPVSVSLEILISRLQNMWMFRSSWTGSHPANMPQRGGLLDAQISSLMAVTLSGSVAAGLSSRPLSRGFQRVNEFLLAIAFTVVRH